MSSSLSHNIVVFCCNWVIIVKELSNSNNQKVAQPSNIVLCPVPSHCYSSNVDLCQILHLVNENVTYGVRQYSTARQLSDAEGTWWVNSRDENGYPDIQLWNNIRIIKCLNGYPVVDIMKLVILHYSKLTVTDHSAAKWSGVNVALSSPAYLPLFPVQTGEVGGGSRRQISCRNRCLCDYCLY